MRSILFSGAKHLSLTLLLIASIITISQAEDITGVITLKSNHDVSTTADNLVNILETKGMTVFNRISHSEGAVKVGLELADTELVIFGNPKVGTPLMQCARIVALDLPQKALIWQDDNGAVWLSYNDPDYLKSRHYIEGCDSVLEKIDNALANFAKAATQ